MPKQMVVLDALQEGGKLLARWFPVFGAAGYSVHYFLGQSEVDSFGPHFNTSYLSQTITGLTPGSEYRVQVRAYDATAEITAARGEATKRPLLPPVTGLSVSAASATSLWVRWNAAPGADRYFVHYKGGSVGTWTQFGGAGASTTRTITGLTAGASYAVRVQAGSIAANAVSIDTYGYGVPEALVPLNLFASSSASGLANVNWNATNIFGSGKLLRHWFVQYESDRGDLGEFTAGRGTTTTTVRGLRPGATYTFRVFAVFADGTRSGPSNRATATIPAATSAPPPPSSLTPRATAWDQISLSWPAPGGGVTGYEVQFQPSGGSWTPVPEVRESGRVTHGPSVSTQTRWVHSGVSPSTSYRYRVRAVNAIGSSSWRFSGWTRTPGKPLAFGYDVNKLDGALAIPFDGYNRFNLRLPALFDGRDEVAGASYSLATEGGVALEKQWKAGRRQLPLTFDPETRLLQEARARLADGSDALVGGLASRLPLTLVLTATAPAPDGRSRTQTFTLTDGRSDDGSRGDSDDGETADSNRAPVFVSATAAQSANAGTAFSYTVPEARDDDGDTVSYKAELYDGSPSPLPAWLTFTGSSRTLSGTPAASDVGTLDILVTATDDGTPPRSATESFTLTVKPAGVHNSPLPPATPPTANAGADLEGRRGGTVALSGSGGLHADGSQAALTYGWRIADASHAELKASTSWLSGADKAGASFSVPRRKDVTDRRAVDNGQWVEFELTVTDGDGETATDRVKMTVRGSTWQAVSLRVADASAKESAGSIAFAVTLSAASRDPVTVKYATSDGTALAGADYTAASGTLTFAKGETSKTVTVTVLDDVHDEGTETFTLTLSDPAPAGAVSLADATATGSISNSDPLQKDWLARFGRAAAGHVAEAIAGRLRGEPRTRVVIGGQSLARGEGIPAPKEEPGGNAFGTAAGAGSTGGDAAWRELGMSELLLASSFHLASAENVDAGSRWSVWGRGTRSSFEGSGRGLSLEGDATTATVGLDYERGRWLVGVALSRTTSEGSFRARGACDAGCAGESEGALTGVTPYARYRVNGKFSVWGAVGYGQGDLTLSPEGARPMGADVDTGMAAGGARGVLLPARAPGGFELALRADLLVTTTRSEATADLAEAEAETRRARLLLEASRSLEVGGGVLTPSVELGLRSDGGDAETGGGLEVGGSVRYAAKRLTAEVSARGLLAHGAEDYEEWGVSVSVRYEAGPRGRGLSMRVGSAWGADSGGAQRLWSGAPGISPGRSFDPDARLETEVGYGMDARRGLLTPYAGLSFSPEAETWRAGARWEPGPAYEVSLEASLTDSASGEGPASGLLLRGSRRW